jgi:2'-5' RNA ligase
MVGVVSLLDDECSALVRSLWESLVREFGPGGMFPDSAPHLSLHVADSYELPEVEKRVKSLASSNPPFPAKTAGLGMFFGESLVVHLPVVRSSRLTVLQRTTRDEICRHAQGDTSLYEPNNWTPHITLGMWPAESAKAGAIVDYIVAQGTSQLALEFTIDSLSAIEDDGEARRVHFTHKFAPAKA